MPLKFSKMHGLGNDFVIIDGINQPFEPTSASIRRIARRRFGVGCDQLLLVEAPTQAGVDFGYRIFNADGTEVEQCGNGARCFARFVKDRGLINRDEIVVATVNGTLRLTVLDDDQVSVDMGVPGLEPRSVPFDAPARANSYALELDGISLQIAALSLGNPHMVLQVGALEVAPVGSLGAALERHPRFPAGVNVGFMEIVDPRNIRLRVFERGVGETMACGSGACAAMVAGRLQDLLDTSVQVELPGGSLRVEWQGEGHSVRMSGPAVHVFDGQLEL